jgi:serine/threonine-protein kinase RsbT
LKRHRPPSTAPAGQRHPVVAESDVYGARNGVRAFAAALGFGPGAQGELVIVVSELATNILKYGVRGAITLSRISDESGRAGIEIAASDEGPAIRDFESALRDGWTDGAPIDPMRLLRRRGIGAGLGAVARLTDSVRYESASPGKVIVARRFLRRSLRPRRSR